MTSSRVENSSSRAARKVKLALMGPAFVAAIGYIDPGNFATNIQAGASFGYQLLWVVVWANLMAMLIQVLSAKLGIATGKKLAEQIRDHYPPPGNESGVAQLWHCACPGAAADIYQQCEADGGPGEYPLGERHRLGDSRYCGEPERLVNSGVAARGGLIDS